MHFEYEVTRDTSSLIEDVGYWSGDTVYFNVEPNKIVILDKKLEVSELIPFIREYLEDQLKANLISFMRKRMAHNQETFCEYIGRGALKSVIKISQLPAFDRPEFKGNGNYSSWPLVVGWLERNYVSESAQQEAIAETLATALLAQPSCFCWDNNNSILSLMLHPWLTETLKNCQRCNFTLEKALKIFSCVAFSSEFVLIKKESVAKFNIKNKENFEQLRSLHVAIPNLVKVNAQRLTTFRHAIYVLFGLLRVKKKILLASAIKPESLMRPYKDFDVFVEGLDRKIATKLSIRKTLVYRIVAISSMNSIADIPETIADKMAYIPNSGCANKSLVPLLQRYAEEHELPSFPLRKLNRVKSQKDTVDRNYSLGWMKSQGLPSSWQKFCEQLWKVNDAGDATSRTQMRCVIEWAWFVRRFESPSSIMASDLRDTHHPDRVDTFYHYVDSGDVKKWDYWNFAQRAFAIVYNYELLMESASPLIPNNPFAALSNPFKTKKSRITHRHRIPNNIHEAMLHLLLSPDEKGKPTYSFVRDTLKLDWFTWRNLKTGNSEKVWCLSRTHLLALLLVLPLRGKQGRWLDQGLMDQMIWDWHSNQLVPNEHYLKDWRYPNGESHDAIYGKPSGVFQPVEDDFIYNDTHLCIYVSTNKTQLWDPETINGYEIWWPRATNLIETDLPTITRQADYIERPYELIEAQRKWIETYDPNPEPVTFADSSCDSALVNKLQTYPYFTPIFRDLTSPYHRVDGVEYFLPVSNGKLNRLFSALAVHVEDRLREENVDVILCEETTSNTNSYDGRRCRYDLHSLRVYGVSYLVELGIPFHIVQMIVGHVTAAMTLHYNKPSSDFMRKVISEKIGSSDFLGDWDDIAADIVSNKREYIVTNPAYLGNDIPDDLLDGDYTGFVAKPGGICPLGGDACNIGQVIKTQSTGSGKAMSYGPVIGGCGNCRFFCSSPAHLFEHQMVINDLFIRLRSVGKQQIGLAKRLGDLQWADCESKREAVESAELKSQLEEIERQLEPLAREWVNRTQMAMKTIEQLDDYLEFLKERKSSSNALVLLSATTAEELAPHIEMRLEKTGEYELARQTLLAAHLQGGIDHCSQLSRQQLREFMDRIMFQEDPRYLLIGIHDEKTRDKVAFLMSETMAAMAGSTAVQGALDNNTGLQLSSQKQQELREWMRTLFLNASQQGDKATLVSLLPSNFHIVDDREEGGL